MSSAAHVLTVAVPVFVAFATSSIAQPEPKPELEDKGKLSIVAGATKAARGFAATSKQPELRTVSGRLDRSDRVLDDGSRYDSHVLQLSAGDTLVAEMRSRDFDSFLMLYFVSDDGLEIVTSDDDSGTGLLDAAISVNAPRSGQYILVANSAYGNSYGTYEISIGIESSAPSVSAESLQASRLTFGRVMNGRLDPTHDDRLSDDTLFDLYSLSGTAGQTVEITMVSQSFDTYLLLADQSGNIIAENDDHGDTTTSMIRITFPITGTYTVLANCFGSDESGNYQLVAELQRQAQSGVSNLDYARLYPGGGRSDDQYALLVGIDDYPGEDNDLASCNNDVTAMRDVLIRHLGFRPENIVVLRDEEATRDHIIEAFRRHLGQVGPRGGAVFYYSGHGTQLPRDVYNQDEADGRDEALFVWGQSRPASTIVDDELGVLIRSLQTENKVIMLDACHAGTGTLGIPTKAVALDDPSVQGTYEVFTEDFPGAKDRGDAGPQDHVLFAAGDSDELALAGGGTLPSVFTFAFVRELERSGPNVPMSDLMRRVRATVRQVIEEQLQLEHDQFPQLEGRDLTRTLPIALGIRR